MKNKITLMLIMFIGMIFSTYSNADMAAPDEDIAASSDAATLPTHWYFLSSFATNRVLRLEQDTGAVLDVLDTPVPGPFGSFVSFAGDLFVAATHTGEVYRFNAFTGEFKDVFVKAGSGCLTNSVAPILTPDSKYLLIGDLTLNGYCRFDGHTGEFINVFADPSTKPINGPFMPAFSPYPELKGKLLIASGFTNSVQIYDVETGNYEGDFVKPGSGGLVEATGVVFGPDGNLYIGSSGTNAVKRYNGRTGEYIDDFVPSGAGGLSRPRGMEFGGSNSDLHVVSNGTNKVLKFDRTTGKLLGVSASGEVAGFADARGLMFSLRPFSFASALPSVISSKVEDQFVPVNVVFNTVRGPLDASGIVELVSITVNDPHRHAGMDVREAEFGQDDRSFLIRAHNDSGSDRIYTFTYRVSKPGMPHVMTTTTVTVASNR